MKRREAISLSAVSLMGSSVFGLPASGNIRRRDSQPGDKLKVIVMGAHPDDPETGCGGTICLLSAAGHEVVSAYLTRGEAGIKEKSHEEAAGIRTAEAKEACRIMNARPEFLGQIDGDCEVNKNRYDEVRRFLEKEQPDLLLTHWPIDTHRDHRACSLLAYDAWLHLGKSFALYYYEVMTGIQSQNFHPGEYVDITAFRDQKYEAACVHESQHIKEMMDEIHGEMERFRGHESGHKYAEAFVRQVQSKKEQIAA